MKARVSKNLKGTLILSTISSQSFKKNDEIDISEEQYWKEDVQAAIRRRFIVLTEGKPEKIKEVEIVKTFKGSVTLPVVNKVLRDSKPFKIKAELLEHREFKKLQKNRMIAVLGAPEQVNKKSPEATEQPVAKDAEDADRPSPAKKKGDAVIWDARAAADQELAESQSAKKPKAAKTAKKAKAKGVVKRINDDNMIFDPEDSERPSKDDKQWVDVEQTEERIKSHPILSKKYKADE